MRARIVDAFATAGNAGVISLDGEMLDVPHLKAREVAPRAVPSQSEASRPFHSPRGLDRGVFAVAKPGDRPHGGGVERPSLMKRSSMWTPITRPKIAQSWASP